MQFLVSFIKINLLICVHYTLVSYPGPKYKKVSFSNPGHAFNLAQRLNKNFDTEDFSVVMLTAGKVVTEDEVKTLKDN